jgi:hypothetical protein
MYSIYLNSLKKKMSRNSLLVRYCLLINLSVILFACSNNSSSELKVYGSQNITVFDGEQISHAHPDANKLFTANESGVVRLAKGRIILKKISVPIFEKSTKVTANVRLTSNGDPWDKSGSLFVIPNSSLINLISLQKKEHKLSKQLVGDDNIQGYISNQDYTPTLELLRFMTPFGVGHFSETEKLQHRKPVYIPHWEKEVVWQQDISDRLTLLEGDVWVGVWVDVWTGNGYKVDVSLSFNESKILQDKRKKQWVSPLVNTISYVHGIKLSDVFSRHDLTNEFTIPNNVTNVKLKYITTGHGGHENGDEFVKNENMIFIDSIQKYKFTPWRDDCASFRRFNPHSGVWTEKVTWKGKEIDERVASSDYSRSNWCPGSDVIPVEIALPELTPGKHSMSISIPKAQAIEGNKMNHWLVSAYLVGDII